MKNDALLSKHISSGVLTGALIVQSQVSAWLFSFVFNLLLFSVIGKIAMKICFAGRF
jgi:hypothetical protein